MNRNVMTQPIYKALLFIGMALFVLSFGMPAMLILLTERALVRESFQGWECAYIGLRLPSGWINPLFLIWFFFRDSRRVQWVPAALALMVSYTWWIMWQEKMIPAF